MKKERQGISCDLARELDIVNYLDSLGITPARIEGYDYWYHSPFREERTPSFKVNRKLNRFYDFGEGWGGNIIDFGIRFYGCSVCDFLSSLSSDSLLHPQTKNIPHRQKDLKAAIDILSVHPISAPSLLRYLDSRKIPKHLAQHYYQQVHYQVGRKNYYGIGFKNDKGGYEIRNPYFKGSSSPKAITTFINGYKNLSVFEGSFDFLSFLVLFDRKPQLNSNFLILNSLSFFGKSFELMEGYSRVDLYLDNNIAGQNCIVKASARNVCYRDQSVAYKNHEDLNDWLTSRFISPDKTDPFHHEPP